MVEKSKLNNFENIDLVRIAKDFGTPVYFYNLDLLEHKFKTLEKYITYKDKKIMFAMKANFNSDVLKLVRDLGGGIDGISIGEVMLAKKIGFKDIIFTGIGVTDEEIDFCIKNNVMLNVGSVDLLERVGRKHRECNVCIRINPDFGAGHHEHVITGGPQSKFGIYEKYLEDVLFASKKYDLKIVGVHFHIGSGVLDYKLYLDAIKKALDVAVYFKTIEFVDIGGGIGIPYRSDENEFNVKEFGEDISKVMMDFSDKEKRNVKLLLEPGRYIVAESGVLLAKVCEIKETPLYRFAILDTGFNHLVRPMMYGSYHEIINLSKTDLYGLGNSDWVIAGNVCESGDIFTRDEKEIKPRKMPNPDYGDIIGIFDVGAYGYSMASHYNLRRFPKEIVYHKGKIKVSEREYLEFVL